MRKNLRRVLDAWHADRPKGTFGASISTDGLTIFSYSTALITTSPHGFVLNVTSYSKTTTTQQNSLRVEHPRAIEVDELPFGATRADLLDAAKEVA